MKYASKIKKKRREESWNCTVFHGRGSLLRCPESNERTQQRERSKLTGVHAERSTVSVGSSLSLRDATTRDFSARDIPLARRNTPPVVYELISVPRLDRARYRYR